MKDNQKIIELIEKYKSGTISEQEKAMLLAWYNQEAAARSAPIHEDDVQESLSRISSRLPLQPVMKPVRMWPRLVAAASILLIAGSMLYYFMNVKQPVQHPLTSIQPGGNKATLQLASGEKIELNSRQEGIMIKGKQVVYNNGGVVAAAGNQLQRMQLITPKGGQYQITLPDGTQVWLNAASKLTYPDRFEGANRQVELEGEAYFSVSKGTQPFIVKSRGQEVIVLGTTFNIMAYADEAHIETALIEGAVKVNDVLLQPGYEAHNINGAITVVKADMKAATAWKNGVFYFKDASVESVMNQLKRWYDIDVEYQNERNGDEFMGQIPRDKPLEKVLEILQLSGINCKVEGRRIIVY